MRTLLISAAICFAFSSTCARAGENCMLATSDEAMRECFDRTFSTTQKQEPAATTQKAKTAPKLASPPKTQSLSDGSTR